MPKRPPPDSPLSAAALAFDEDLAAYARLAKLLLEAPLDSARHVERANQFLEQVAATEEKLGETGRLLAEQIAAARVRQQELADAMIAHVPQLQERNQQLRLILEELGQIAAAAREINATAGGGPAAIQAVDDSLVTLTGRAEDLAQRARDSGFDDLAGQAHAIHQQLLSALRKIRAATLRSPS